MLITVHEKHVPRVLSMNWIINSEPHWPSVTIELNYSTWNPLQNKHGHLATPYDCHIYVSQSENVVTKTVILESRKGSNGSWNIRRAHEVQYLQATWGFWAWSMTGGGRAQQGREECVCAPARLRQAANRPLPSKCPTSPRRCKGKPALGE